MNKPMVSISILGVILFTALTPLSLSYTFSQEESPLTANFIGIKINSQNPSKPEFITNFNNEHLDKSQQRTQFNKLVHYFQDAVSIPEKDIWVDPYQRSRNISKKLEKTAFGHDLLSQSYLLKNISFSLHNYQKTWVVPDKVVIFQKGDAFYIKEATLKIMTQLSAQEQLKNKVFSKLYLMVNEGKDFYLLRQLYNVMILAKVYKKQIAQQMK